jgi:hypothetical protein
VFLFQLPPAVQQLTALQKREHQSNARGAMTACSSLLDSANHFEAYRLHTSL